MTQPFSDFRLVPEVPLVPGLYMDPKSLLNGAKFTESLLSATLFSGIYGWAPIGVTGPPPNGSRPDPDTDVLARADV